MVILLFISCNLLMMSAFFLVGIHQFMQVDDKRKVRSAGRLRRPLSLMDPRLDTAELRELVRAERYDEALQRLMNAADVDRFTAESAIEGLKKQECRPYQTSKP